MNEKNNYKIILIPKTARACLTYSKCVTNASQTCCGC